MKEIERHVLTKVERRFTELRDELLAASHEFAKSENHDWAKAERFFAASKKVDELWRSVLTPIASSTTDQMNISRADVNGAETTPADGKSKKKSKKDYPKYSVRS